MSKLYYIANIRLPTEKAHGVQIMHMCEAFAVLGKEVELIVPTRHTHIDADPFEYYGVKKNFTIKRLWCIDAVSWGRIGFWIQTLTFVNSVLWYVLARQGIFYTRDESVAFFLEAFYKKPVWEVHMGQKNIFARILLRLGTPLVTITRALKKQYEAMGVRPERILVAHDAYDPERFTHVPERIVVREELRLPKDAFIVGYIGKYKTGNQSKGVEDIITPFKKLLDAHTESFLLIVGPEEAEVQELQKEIRTQGVKDNAFRIVPHVPHSETSQYMRAANLLVLPYPNTHHYAYNMSPLKLFAYMGSGTPVVASDLPSLREVLHDTSALFFNPDQGGALYESLVYAIEHKEELQQRAVQAYHDSLEYTWHNRAQSILKFIRA